MTKIEWTDETWNPVTGCTKVSQGCKNCYAERLAPKVFAGQTVRLGQSIPGLGRVKEPAYVERKRVFTDVWTHPDRLDAPLHWKKPRRIFVNSMSDLFHEDVPFEFIASVFAIMACTTRHSYQILTKRPQRMLDFFKWESQRQDSDGEWYELRPGDFAHGDRISEHWPAGVPWIPLGQKGGGYDNCGPGWPYENVWLGVSVEDQATADERIPLLLQTPAAIRFLSCEPLLGPIDLRRYVEGYEHHGVDMSRPVGARVGACIGWTPPVDWVITGGESGPKARPSHPDWFRSLRDQCAAAHVPFFFKQWGQFIPHSCAPFDHQGAHTAMTLGKQGVKMNGDLYWSVGKKAAGRLLDGREHMEWPT